jgi:hypothetical protein
LNSSLDLAPGCFTNRALLCAGVVSATVTAEPTWCSLAAFSGGCWCSTDLDRIGSDTDGRGGEARLLAVSSIVARAAAAAAVLAGTSTGIDSSRYRDEIVLVCVFVFVTLPLLLRVTPAPPSDSTSVRHAENKTTIFRIYLFMYKNKIK